MWEHHRTGVNIIYNKNKIINNKISPRSRLTNDKGCKCLREEDGDGVWRPCEEIMERLELEEGVVNCPPGPERVEEEKTNMKAQKIYNTYERLAEGEVRMNTVNCYTCYKIVDIVDINLQQKKASRGRNLQHKFTTELEDFMKISRVNQAKHENTKRKRPNLQQRQEIPNLQQRTISPNLQQRTSPLNLQHRRRIRVQRRIRNSELSTPKITNFFGNVMK